MCASAKPEETEYQRRNRWHGTALLDRVGQIPALRPGEDKPWRQRENGMLEMTWKTALAEMLKGWADGGSVPRGWDYECIGGPGSDRWSFSHWEDLDHQEKGFGPVSSNREPLNSQWCHASGRTFLESCFMNTEDRFFLPVQPSSPHCHHSDNNIIFFLVC
jgi:hypothetical protein